MANEIIKYHNDFNNLALKNFNSQELDLLMTLFMIAKEQDTKEIKLSFEQLKGISKYQPTANSRFIDDLVRTNKKLLNLDFIAISEDKRYIAQFVLFPTFIVDIEEMTLTIAVNEKFKWILNSLTSQFTRFELEEFIDLKSQYAKTAYRHLKQFRQTGYWTVDIEKFREVMDIPKSYQMRDISKFILKPIEEELSPIFKNLTIKKRTKGRGGRIFALEFIWTKESKAAPAPADDYYSRKKKKSRNDEYIRNDETYSDDDLFDKL